LAGLPWTGSSPGDCLTGWLVGWLAGWLVEPSLGRTLLAWQKFCAVTRAGESGAI